MNPDRRRTTNITVRVATAAIGIPLVLLVNYWGGWVFAAAMALVAAMGTTELLVMLRKPGYRPLLLPALVATTAVAALPVFVHRPQAAWIGIVIAVLMLTGALFLARQAQGRSPVDWVLTLLPVLYVGLLLGHLTLLRELPRGAWWVLLVLLTTWAYDTGAFFTGTFLGRRPFMQHISAKKTVEGVLGGVLCSTLVALVGIPGVGLAWWEALLLGIAMGPMAQAGDLVESLLKRQTGVKDSGAIVPGHGGLLDRIDSLLFTATLTYYAAMLFNYAP